MFSRSTKLDRMLTKSIRFIEEKGWTIEDCLNQYASYRVELEPLLRTAVQLRRAREYGPSSTFQSNAHSRLQKRIQSSRRSPWIRGISAASAVPRSATATPSRLRLAGSLVPLLLAILITFSVGGGIAYAADQAKPGDVLFQIDRAIEQAQIRLENDRQQIVRLYLKFAGERVDELMALMKAGNTEDIPYGLAEYEAQIAATAPLITKAQKEGEDVSMLALETSERITAHKTKLEAILMLAPIELRESILAAIDGVEKVRKVVISPVPMEEPMAQSTPESMVFEPATPTQKSPTLPAPTHLPIPVPSPTTIPPPTAPPSSTAISPAPSATAAPPGAADLVCEDIMLEPENPEVNMVLKISGVVSNQGPLSAGDFKVIFCIDSSTEACYEEKEGNIGSYLHFSSLSPGASVKVHTYSWLPDTAGEHVVHLCADVDHSVLELDESAFSNCASKTFTVLDSGLMPDLTITALDWPTEAYESDDVVFFFRVSNDGTGTAGSGYLNQLLIDGQLVPNLGTEIGTWEGRTLVPGGAESNGFVWHATCGEHQVITKTDANHQVSESNEDNNITSSHTIIVYCPAN